MMAEDVIVGLWPDGTRRTIRFQVGAPYENKPGEWRCPVSVAPLHERIADIGGSSSMHSLCLAIAMGIDLLEFFIEDGGKLEHVDGTRFRIPAPPVAPD